MSAGNAGGEMGIEGHKRRSGSVLCDAAWL